MSVMTLKCHFGKCLNEYGRFKAKYLYRGVGTFWGLSGGVEVHTFVLILMKKTQKSNHRNSRFFSLKIVNRNKIKLSSWYDTTNFHHKNKAGINVYLTKYFRYRKSNYHSTRILVNETSNLNKNIQNLSILARYKKIYVKNLRKNNVKMTQFHWSRNSRDSCPTSSGKQQQHR